MATYELESSIKDKCKKWLDKNGWFSFNIHQQGMYCHKGISDRIAVKDGAVIFIEFKTMSKKSVQSDDQKRFEEKINSHGGRYILVRSLEDMIEQITWEKQLKIGEFYGTNNNHQRS